MNGDKEASQLNLLSDETNRPPNNSLVISVRQPWAWLLIRPDIVGVEERRLAYLEGLIKDIENRDWPTKVRGRVHIHASLGMTRDEYEHARNFAWHMSKGRIEVPDIKALQRGGIVGSTNLTDCVTRSESLWFFGKYGFVSQDAQPLPFYPCRGQLGFFRI